MVVYYYYFGVVVAVATVLVVYNLVEKIKKLAPTSRRYSKVLPTKRRVAGNLQQQPGDTSFSVASKQEKKAQL